MGETRDSLMTLEDISMSYGVIMVDTCVLIGNRHRNSPKKDKIKRGIKSADFIIKKLRSGIDISVTKGF